MKKTILPPTFFLAALCLTVAARFAFPLMPFTHPSARIAGAFLLMSGIFINLAADRLFKRAGTTVKPFEQSSAFLREWPFSFTRNPMYLGMTFILFGLGLMLGSVPSLLVAFAFAVFIDRRFIVREEKDMASLFGQEFEQYKKQVRRWI